MTDAALQELWEKYLADELSEAEFSLLWSGLRQPEHKDLCMELIGSVWGEPAFHGLSGDAGRRMALEVILPGQADKPRVVKLVRGWWAAAAAVLVLATGAWLFYRSPARQRVAAREQAAHRDVSAGVDAAVLTLADGHRVLLDSAAKGVIGHEGGVSIENMGGRLVYRGAREKAGHEMSNTLTTQRGNRYQLVLPDGSKVWLNAASSITYPASFSGGKRKVCITGEVYLEIAKDVQRPFLVSVKGMEVEVLGTQFNINAYPDEGSVRTTLLEGSVRVKDMVLKPGEEALLDARGSLRVAVNGDPEKAVAWKNNLFIFSNDDLMSVMRQLSRWYNAEVRYKDEVKGLHFSGIISRDNRLSQVLTMLRESTDKVKFEVDGGIITVLR